MGCTSSKKPELYSMTTVDDYRQNQMKKMTQQIQQRPVRQLSIDNSNHSQNNKSGKMQCDQITNDNSPYSNLKINSTTSTSTKDRINLNKYIQNDEIIQHNQSNLVKKVEIEPQFTFRKDGKFGKKANPQDLQQFLDNIDIIQSQTDIQ